MPERPIHRYVAETQGALCEATALDQDSLAWREERVTCPACLAIMAFRWPCHRREAHGPHQPHPPGVTMGHPGEPCSCPGVKAHPLVMIGRSG